MILRSLAPPALPYPGAEFNARYQDQLNNAHRIFYNQLATAVNAVIGPYGGGYLQVPHAMFMSTADQASAGVTSENLVTYNQPVIAQGIEVRNGHEIWFPQTGNFLVTLSLMFTNRGNAAQTIEVWAKDTAQNYPLSNTRFDISARKSGSEWAHAVATITGVFTVTDPDTNYLAIAWWSDGADVFLEHYPEGTSPTRPAIPSAILTANFVSRLP